MAASRTFRRACGGAAAARRGGESVGAASYEDLATGGATTRGFVRTRVSFAEVPTLVVARARALCVCRAHRVLGNYRPASVANFQSVWVTPGGRAASILLECTIAHRPSLAPAVHAMPPKPKEPQFERSKYRLKTFGKNTAKKGEVTEAALGEALEEFGKVWQVLADPAKDNAFVVTFKSTAAVDAALQRERITVGGRTEVKLVALPLANPSLEKKEQFFLEF
mgnify:CR=1 FL=1